MIIFKAKILNSDQWFEGSSLIETSGGYVILKGGMEWIDGREWSDENHNWNYIDFKTLLIGFVE